MIDGNGQGVIFSGEGGATSSNNLVDGNVITNSQTALNVESWWGGPAVGQRQRPARQLRQRRRRATTATAGSTPQTAASAREVTAQPAPGS